ncbi:MAG: hypothetical protein ACI9OJ_004172 [Myxococcota bacterium]
MLQADHTGPALIVVAPTDRIVAGDRVSLVVTRTVMGLNGYPTVTQFDDLSVTGRAELFDIIQDLSTNAAIVNSDHTFHDEYITVTGRLLGDPQPPLGEPAIARLATDGFFMSSASSAGLFLRFPAALLPELPGLTSGCAVTVERGYLHFDYHAMCTVMAAEDITIGDCPAPQVVGAAAPTPTQVTVTFSRPLEPTSVDPTHFSFDVAFTPVPFAE